MNALVSTASPSLAYAEMERLADAIAKSNLFGIRTKEQALVLMAIAQAEGRHPALAARDFDIIQGRPAKKSEAMLRDFLEGGGGKVQWHNLNDTIADATFSHPQGGSVRVVWDMERAKRAGLGGKDMWQKYPRQMLRSRCVSEGVRTIWPSATSGMYVPEEAATIDGTLADSTPAPEVTTPPPAPELSRREQINRDIPMDQPPPRRTVGQFLDQIEVEFRQECHSLDDVNALIATDDVQRAMQTFRNGHKSRLDGILAEAIHRFSPKAPPEGDDWPGPDPEQMRREREAAAVA